MHDFIRRFKKIMSVYIVYMGDALLQVISGILNLLQLPRMFILNTRPHINILLSLYLKIHFLQAWKLQFYYNRSWARSWEHTEDTLPHLWCYRPLERQRTSLDRAGLQRQICRFYCVDHCQRELVGSGEHSPWNRNTRLIYTSYVNFRRQTTSGTRR